MKNGTILILSIYIINYIITIIMSIDYFKSTWNHDKTKNLYYDKFLYLNPILAILITFIPFLNLIFMFYVYMTRELCRRDFTVNKKYKNIYDFKEDGTVRYVDEFKLNKKHRSEA